MRAAVIPMVSSSWVEYNLSLQGGTHDNGRQTFGHSMIVDPWGSILAEQKDLESVITADLDLQRLRQLRKQFPCNEHHVLKAEIK